MTKEERRLEFLDKQVPPKRRLLVERAFAATCPPRAAIKAHCFICAGMDIEEAKSCKVELCALYEYNPYRKRANSEGIEEVSAEENANDEEAAD